jgi:hypothetical protein
MNVSYKGLVSGLALTILSGGLAFAAGATPDVTATTAATASPAVVKPAASVAQLKYSNSGIESFVSAYFSYDDDPDSIAVQVNTKGTDTFGAFTGLCVGEYVADGDCTAPDKTDGTEFDLVSADCVNLYVKSLVFSHYPSQNGVECSSNTTGSFTQTVTGALTSAQGILKVTGGGSITGTATGIAPTTPEGALFGTFGGGMFSVKGTYTNK